MKLKAIATTSLIVAMAVGRADAVYADADGLVGGIIGGIIGGAIVNEANKSNRRTTTTRSSTRSSGISSAQREANREVQVALNHFGYPVGTPDGSIGPKSRGAISQYQVLLGYPPTGQLTEYERTLLVTAYQRTIMGGPLVAQTVATHPLGMQGFLLVQRDEMAGIRPVVPAADAGVLAAVPDAALPVLPSLVAEPAAPVEAAADPAALPSFMGSGAAQVSLASSCNKISLVTNTNGGYTTAAAMTDPIFALSEQFCLARTYAMATGEELAAQAAGFTPAQITEQCQAFGPVLKDQVAALSLQPRDQVLAGVQAFVLKSGMSPAQLTGTAKVCLGVGYTTDNMDVAIGSALLLTSLGEGAYGELLGHHLSQGYGANLRPDLALDWYDTGLAAMGAGAAIFAPGLTDRQEVIRKAAFTIGGRAMEEEPALPQFAATPDPVAEPEVVAAPIPEAEEPASPEKNLASAREAVIVPEAVAAAPVAEAPQPSLLPSTGAQVVLMAARLPFLLFSN